MHSVLDAAIEGGLGPYVGFTIFIICISQSEIAVTL